MRGLMPGRGDPDDRDEGNEAQRHARMLEGERDRDEIDEEGELVFAFDGLVLRFEPARVAQTASRWPDAGEES